MRLLTGLRLSKQRDSLRRMSAPRGWERPVASIYDVRDGIPCIDDQGNTSECVAYTAEAWLQIRGWRKTHLPENLTLAHGLYEQAKRIDGLGGGDGTTPEAVFEACKMAGYLSPSAQDTFLPEYDDLLWALASHGPVWASFHLPDTFEAVGPDGYFEDSDRFAGYHEMLALQYDESRRVADRDIVPVLNSWGPRGWASRGIWRFTPDQMARYFMGGNLITDLEQRGCV
jgi:hypothetical protein